MKTLILNGSPKGKRGNSQIFTDHFIKGMGVPCDSKCIVGQNYEVLAKQMEMYDTIIVIMPLYVHAMPGIVMKLFEQMQPLVKRNKSLGFIVQSGFAESAQSRYARRSFELLCKRLNYRCLGTVIKGGSAGVYLMSDNMNKKLFAGLEELGYHYKQTGCFSKAVRERFEKKYEFTKFEAGFYQFLNKTGVGDMFWNSMLKKNNAYKDRTAKPFEFK